MGCLGVLLLAVVDVELLGCEVRGGVGDVVVVIYCINIVIALATYIAFVTLVASASTSGFEVIHFLPEEFHSFVIILF